MTTAGHRSPRDRRIGAIARAASMLADGVPAVAIYRADDGDLYAVPAADYTGVADVALVGVYTADVSVSQIISDLT
jgi:hypothetical protein